MQDYELSQVKLENNPSNMQFKLTFSSIDKNYQLTFITKLAKQIKYYVSSVMDI